MANVSFYLDTRRARHDGTMPLRLTVRFNNKVVMVSTDIWITTDQWHPGLSRVIGHPRRKQLNSYLDTLRLNAEQAMRELKASGEALSTKIVRSRIVSRNKASNSQPTFIELFLRVAEDARNKERTREIYRATLKKLMKYAEHLNVDASEWTFEDITRSWLADFDTWLMGSSPSRNARNIHLRNIRHVCNVAVTEHITSFYDFRGFSIKAVPTVKRSLTVEKLRQLFALDVEEHQRKYLDCFKLIFCLIGINTIDLCHLKKTDVVEGRVEYTRSKTGRNYSIRIEPEAEELLDKYSGKDVWLVGILDRYSNFKDFAHDMIALSVGYTRKVGRKTVTYFDTYTAEKHYKWSDNGGGGWVLIEEDDIHVIGKIPGVYMYRSTPIWEDTSKIVYEMEWAVSRNGNYLRKNSKPLFCVFADEEINYGQEGNENAEFKSILQYPKGSTAGYVTWAQAVENLKFHITELRQSFFTQLQLPDWSYESMKSTPMSGESRKQLFIDAQLKVRDESGRLLEFFDREVNVVKAFLKVALGGNYAAAVDALPVENQVTAFTISEEKDTINNLLAANGNKPLLSQRESIEQLGWSDDVEKTLQEINEESALDAFEITR